MRGKRLKKNRGELTKKKTRKIRTPKARGCCQRKAPGRNQGLTQSVCRGEIEGDDKTHVKGHKGEEVHVCEPERKRNMRIQFVQKARKMVRRILRGQR